MKSYFIKLMNVSLLIICISSCSTIEFVQNGKEKFKVASVAGSDKVFEVEGSTDFYFWGLLPRKATVDLSSEFDHLGINLPCMVKVSRINSVQSILYSVFTLGLYLPEEYKISVYSTGIEHK